MAPRGDGLQAAAPIGVPPARETRRGEALSREAFVWFAGSICGFLHIPFDAALLGSRFAPPHSAAQLIRALHELGCESRPLDARSHGRDGAAEDDRSLVGIAWLRGQAIDEAYPVLIVRLGAREVVLFRALSENSETLPRAELRSRLVGAITAFVARTPEPADPDAVPAQPRFGFRWFVPHLLQHRRIWCDVLVASAAIQLLALGTPLMTQAIIDKVVVHRTESTLIAIGCGLCLFLVFSAALTWIRQHLVLHTGMRVDAVLAGAVFRHLVSLPPRYFEHRPTGVIAARLHGIEAIREFLASAAISLVLDLPFLSIALAIMFSYSPWLTLLAAGILALIVAVSLAVAPLFQQRLNREFQHGARNQGFLTEYVAGIETVKALQMEPILERRYGDYQAAYLQAARATRETANTYNVLATTLEQAMTLLILVVGAYFVMTPSRTPGEALTVGMLVAFQMFAARMSQPVMRLVGLWQQFQQARIAVRRLGDLMDARPEPYTLLPMRHGVATRDAPVIETRALAFRHADDRPFLYQDLNLCVHAGECVALTGPSGCGKSTLAKLLQGFYPPTHGSVLVNGIDARHLAANELRATFGVVPQETVLFGGTVLENLLLANADASFADAVPACRLAGIHQTIESLPSGYQTRIGERGVGLSGGQRQRIAIARALLRQPQVLILDEATTNLDPASAAGIARTIDALRGRMTILVIAHAPLGALRFDRVIRLDAAAPAEPQP